MLGVALYLSIALQPLPADATAWVLEPEELNVLGHTLERMGQFQYPYPAALDLYDPEAGTMDATVDVSAARLGDGTPVILIEDDGVEDDDGTADIQHYLVLQAPWNGLPAGTLLHRDGENAAVVTHSEDDPARARAEVMLGFLELMLLFADPPPAP